MINKEKNFVSAIIYIHNTEKSVELFLTKMIEVMENNFENSEIICVNDSSDENSISAIKRTSEVATTTSVSVINMSYFHGLELSMNAGMDMAIGDFVFEFDNTNLDFDTDTIMKVYRRALEGYDIVSASADKKEKTSSRLFYKVFERYSDNTGKMCTESFRVLSRRVLNRIGAMNKSTPYRKVVYTSCGLKTDNIKYKVVNNISATSDKKEDRFRKKLAIDSLILFTSMGYSFAKMMTIFMMLVSAFMIVYSIVVYATSSPTAGWTTTILFLSFVFFGLFGILTIIIKYLQLLVELVFKRKQYSFESIEKFTK